MIGALMRSTSSSRLRPDTQSEQWLGLKLPCKMRGICAVFSTMKRNCESYKGNSSEHLNCQGSSQMNHKKYEQFCIIYNEAKDIFI